MSSPEKPLTPGGECPPCSAAAALQPGSFADFAACLQALDVQVGRVADAAAGGEPLALAALKRVPAKEAAGRGGRRLRPDGPERLGERDGTRLVAVGPLELDCFRRAPGLAACDRLDHVLVETFAGHC